MGRTRRHPKKGKWCVFCKYWLGDADLKFVSSVIGYEFEMYCDGKCMKRNIVKRTYIAGCNQYEPSYEASKLL